jgi:NitT/TauT family transport system permease protein
VRILALVAGLLVWHWATAARMHAYIRFDHVPSPESVALAFAHNLGARDFYVHILVSLRRILVGYALASAFGVALGILVGRLRFARQVVIPYVELLRPIPAVAWIPLAT